MKSLLKQKGFLTSPNIIETLKTYHDDKVLLVAAVLLVLFDLDHLAQSRLAIAYWFESNWFQTVYTIS